MRTAVLVTTAAAVLFAAPVAESVEPSPARCGVQVLRLKYEVNRDRAAHAFGRAAVGRDVRRTGSCTELGRSVRTFRRWLNQPGASVASSDRSPTRHRTSPRNTGGMYAIPAYIVWRESRGSYFARNPSGAYGAYQLMPFHWGAECAGLGMDPAGQDACAAILWDGGRGSAHWAATR